jgi:hypothetical protein
MASRWPEVHEATPRMISAAASFRVGTIEQRTFATTVRERIPPQLAGFLNAVLQLFDRVVDVANGPVQELPFAPTGAVLAPEHDAFSYARVDVSEDASGEARLPVTVLGNPNYAAGANDPSLVRDLFTIEMP